MDVHHHLYSVEIGFGRKKRTHYFQMLLIILVASCCFTSVKSQPLPDSVRALYNVAKTNSDKGKCLYHYLFSIKEDSNYFNKLLELNSYFEKKNDPAAQDYVKLSAAAKLSETGDFATALSQLLQVLSNFEKVQDEYGKMNSYMWIGSAIERSRDFDQAIAYYKKVIPIARLAGDKEMLSRANNDVSAAYAQINMPDSGLVYGQQSVAIDYEVNDLRHLSYSLGTLGENYIAKKEYDLATPFIRKAYLLSLSFNDSWPIAWNLNDLAQIFLETNRHDSARHYAQMAVELANEKGFKSQSVRSYEYLYRSFEKTDTKDSVYKYFRLAINTKDSLYTSQKAKDIQAINFREQLRQQELATERTKAEEERKDNIQYAAIAIGLILFISIFLLLSRSVIVNEKWISFLGILGLLIVFEFINLFFHPYIAGLTNHSPVLMLFALVAIAALLIPLHHRLEHWIKHKMVEKNKKIRLEAARKTIEQLENKNS